MIELAQQYFENVYDADNAEIFDYSHGDLTIESFNNLVSALNIELTAQKRAHYLIRRSLREVYPLDKTDT